MTCWSLAMTGLQILMVRRKVGETMGAATSLPSSKSGRIGMTGRMV